MEFASISPPLIDCSRDAVVIPDKQRPLDNPVGPEFHDQQLSRHVQQCPLTTGPVQGVPEIPGDQHAMFHGLASIGPGPAQASPYGNVHPGGPCLHAPSPGPPRLSFDQMMLRCSNMMGLLVQQQHRLQQALAAMAAAPSSTIRAMHKEDPLQHQSEVMLAAQRSPAPCQQVTSTNPHSSIKVCHALSVSGSNQSLPFVIPAQSIRALEAAEIIVQPAGEMFRDVIGDDHDLRKFVQDSNHLVEQPGSIDVDSSGQRFQPSQANPFSHLITEAPVPTTVQNVFSADVIDLQREQPIIRSVTYSLYDAAQNEPGRHKQVNINPIISSSAEHGHTGVQQYPSPLSKVVANANGSFQLHNTTVSLWPKEGKYMSYVEQLPPWPPLVCALSSPTHTASKCRGGREDVKLLSNHPIGQAFYQMQQKRTTREPPATSSIKLLLIEASCQLKLQCFPAQHQHRCRSHLCRLHHLVQRSPHHPHRCQAVSILPESTSELSSVVVSIVVLP